MRPTPVMPAIALTALLLSGCGESIPSDESNKSEQPADVPAKVTTVSVTVSSPSETSSVTLSEPDISETDSSGEEEGILLSEEDIHLYDIDGSGTDYSFTYGGESFSARYTYENWRIYDSYKITNKADMYYICSALLDTHPLHGSDGESYRTPEDMVYEWSEHNWAYLMLPEDSPWRINTKDVDFNPEDQGKSAVDMALDRLGEKYGRQQPVNNN